MTSTLLSENLLGILRAAAPLLKGISSEDFAAKPDPERWSKKEILGHLIDSAYNNHARFLRAAADGNLRFAGYDQTIWVHQNNYQQRDAKEVIDTFLSAQRHLAYLIAGLPEGSLNRQTTEHEFHRMAMRKVAPETKSSLGFLVEDYQFHLMHHLRQILPGFTAEWHAGYSPKPTPFRRP